MISVYIDRNVDLKKLKEAFESERVPVPRLVTSAIEGYDRFSQGVIQVSSCGRPTWSDDLRWNDTVETFDDQSTEKYKEIKAIIGKNNREDVIHFDTALKHHCVAFVTNDNGILVRCERLEQLTKIKVFKDPVMLARYIAKIMLK